MADLTPTWRGILRDLIRTGAIRCNPGIEDELLRLASAMDAVVKAQKDGRLDLSCLESTKGDDLEELASPVSHFVADCCEIDPGSSATASELFAAWQGWCTEHGRDHVGTRERFGRDLRAAVPSLRTSRPRRADGRREAVYAGIRVRLF